MKTPISLTIREQRRLAYLKVKERRAWDDPNEMQWLIFTFKHKIILGSEDCRNDG